jgi:hypothetical protein
MATVKRTIITTLSAGLLASTLFVTPSPALAQLTPTEVACRNQGQFFYDRAIERDRGWSITDSMLQIRKWAKGRSDISPALMDLWSGFTQMVHNTPEFTPTEQRKMAESACFQSNEMWKKAQFK